MTQNRQRRQRQVAGQGPAPEPTPPVDPLASLRDADADPRDLPQADPPGDDPEDPEDLDVQPLALVTQERWDEARREVVVAFHADTTAVGFLHKGGACGCHYLAGTALRVVLPVQPDDTEDDQDAEV